MSNINDYIEIEVIKALAQNVNYDGNYSHEEHKNTLQAQDTKSFHLYNIFLHHEAIAISAFAFTDSCADKNISILINEYVFSVDERNHTIFLNNLANVMRTNVNNYFN